MCVSRVGGTVGEEGRCGYMEGEGRWVGLGGVAGRWEYVGGGGGGVWDAVRKNMGGWVQSFV